MAHALPTFTAVLLAATLTGHAGGAAAANSSAPDADELKPRYAVDESRLQATPDRTSVDRRFRLESHMRRSEQRGQSAGGLTLQARLVDATATACDAGAIFANGFE